MGSINGADAGRVVIVTGGGNGIGAATCWELARRGANVVVVDPGVGVRGEARDPDAAATLAAQITSSGGTARASTASVTDRQGIATLFAETAEEFGRLDAVVNPAGILRFEQLRASTLDDWCAVLDVHVNGYLNVLEAALPIMGAAGHGRVVGFTSGAGLARTSVDGPAYGCSKRTVAALTWQLAPLLPTGVQVNALSPIAATRMVREGLIAIGVPGASGLDLTAMPQAHDMAPAAALLSNAPQWCNGRVIYSAGSEMCVMSPPRVIEIVRTRDVADMASALGTISPVVLAPAEAAQRTAGGSNPRFGNVFTRPPDAAASAPGDDAPVCVIVCDDRSMVGVLAEAMRGWGLAPISIEPPSVGEVFSDGAALVARVAGAREVDAVIVALTGAGDGGDADSWRSMLETHRAVPDHIAANAAWARAAALHAAASGRSVRSVHVTRAVTAAGRSAAQAVAQMSRSINETSGDVPVHCFTVALETLDRDADRPVAELVARLARADDTLALRGAELFADANWIGIRSHPAPMATVSFGGPEIPGWIDGALQRIIA
ncbi:MAG: SDR family NAD(P)-dependent oxidoreductase [Acidimicrobiia bacterium]